MVYEETIYLGTINGDYIPADSYYYLGGAYEPDVTLIPFVGHKFMSIICTEIAIMSSAIRWEVMKDTYATIKGNWAYTTDLVEGSKKVGRNHFGYGVSAGIMTPIGPIEASLLNGDDDGETIYSVTIGYYF